MARLGRKKLPEKVAEAIPAGQRVMAWATGPIQLNGEPTFVIATDKSLIAPGYMEPTSWTDLARAEWSNPLLEVVSLDSLAGNGRPVRIHLDQPGSVPQVVWERIESRIILQRHVPLVGKEGVRLIAKRSDDGDDVQWIVIFDVNVDSQDPELRAKADEALQLLRDSTGI